MALAARTDKKSFRTYCLIGDGETQEGQIWEAALCAGNYKLSNLCTFLDANQFQIDGAVKDVMDLEPIADKFKAFKWNVIDINGHDMGAILTALAEARKETTKPTLILARTIKGKGVKFMEGDNQWHGKSPTAEQLKQALQELGN
jgi:transketolase